MPYRAVQTLLNGGAAPGNCTYWRSACLPDLTDAVIEEFIGLAEIAAHTDVLPDRLGDRRGREPGAG